MTHEIITETEFDVVFNNNENSNSKGFSAPLQYCVDYIDRYINTNESYFADYKGGTVSIVGLKSGVVVFETVIPN